MDPGGQRSRERASLPRATTPRISQPKKWWRLLAAALRQHAAATHKRPSVREASMPNTGGIRNWHDVAMGAAETIG